LRPWRLRLCAWRVGLSFFRPTRGELPAMRGGQQSVRCSMQGPTLCRPLLLILRRIGPLEGEQFARAFNPFCAAFHLKHVKPARRELARRARRANGRVAHIANRFDLLRADCANDVIDVCHAATMTSFLTMRKTILCGCDKKIIASD
jgi:hypothetical protein